MNNDQFRRLVASTPRQPSNGASTSPRPGATPSSGLLGSRSRSSIPMTPRTVKGSTGIDFARQLAERDSAAQPTKKFRSSAAPKGTKLAAGYRDRTADRVEDDEDDKAKRVKALEEAMKLGQIDRPMFEKLRDEITGGDIGSTHLVKGLDWRLLERVRRGEDVLNSSSGRKSGEGEGREAVQDVDEEFGKLEDREIAPVTHEKAEKKGEMAPPPPPKPVAGVKRSRNDILAELKAQRKAAAEAEMAAKIAAQPKLGAKFKRVGEKRETSRIERDEKGREVLITVDAEGNVKRKVRKARAEEGHVPHGLSMPDKDAKPLGMEVPEVPAAPVQDEDEDIFEGVGSYDPLAGIGDDESASEAEDGEIAAPPEGRRTSPSPEDEEAPSPSASPPADMPPSPEPSAPRNYFDTPSTTTTEDPKFDVRNDPTILAALQKAKRIDTSALSTADRDETDEEREARLKKRAAMLAASDRDLEDLDMGFGSSRFADAEEAEEEGRKVKLSQWKGVGADDDEDEEHEGRGGKKRKRGPKKRKGDKDSAADVLKVLERRKEGK